MRSAALAFLCFVIAFGGLFLWLSRGKVANEVSTPRQMLLGKWEVLEPTVVTEMGLSTMDFTPEGAWHLTYKERNTSQTLKGTYKFLGENVVWLELKSPVGIQPAGTVVGEVTVDVTKDALVLTPKVGQGDLIFKLKRVK